MPAESDLVLVGDEAPDFMLESPGRGGVSLSGYRGREQVLLMFMRAFG
jgi:peroxiredoxin